MVNLRRSDDIEDQLAEMIAMRDEGKIGGIGLSSITIDELGRDLRPES